MYCRPVRRPLRVRDLENRCKELERENAFLIDSLREKSLVASDEMELKLRDLERENNFLRGMNESLTWVPKQGYDELEKANKALMGEVEYLRKRLSEATKNYKLCKAVSTRSGKKLNAIRDILEGEV